MQQAFWGPRPHTVARALKVFTLAESLGGVESLVSHPVTMTHAAVPREQRESFGLTEGLLRLSVGIEDLADLQADLEQGLGTGGLGLGADALA